MKREKGRATLVLTLSNGELIAYNENNARVLHRRKMYQGEWDELWSFIAKEKNNREVNNEKSN
tara:strand:- start:124 stop:312 length:189 start_codon:yes stop_codon:yes gene_type:complete